MLLCERALNAAIRKFFCEMRLQRPQYWNQEKDLLFLKKAVPAFVSALEEIEPIDYCYGHDETKVFKE